MNRLLAILFLIPSISFGQASTFTNVIIALKEVVFTDGTTQDTAAVSANLLSVSNSIASNTVNITINTGSIATNAGNIATNTTLININTGNITTNTTLININIGNIATNTGNITTNTGNIATNTTLININIGDITTNRTLIDTNTHNIAVNSNAIDALERDIVFVPDLTATNNILPATRYGANNTMNNAGSDHGIILFGRNNKLQDANTDYAMVGGENNFVWNNGKYQTIINGKDNTSVQDYTFMGGALTCYIGSDHSVLLGGESSKIGDSTVATYYEHSAILSSLRSEVGFFADDSPWFNHSSNTSGRTFGRILGGTFNKVNGAFGTVVNGNKNAVMGPYSTIINGRVNVIDAENTNCVIVSGEFTGIDTTNNYSFISGRGLFARSTHHRSYLFGEPVLVYEGNGSGHAKIGITQTNVTWTTNELVGMLLGVYHIASSTDGGSIGVIASNSTGTVWYDVNDSTFEEIGQSSAVEWKVWESEGMSTDTNQANFVNMELNVNTNGGPSDVNAGVNGFSANGSAGITTNITLTSSVGSGSTNQLTFVGGILTGHTLNP